MKSRRSRTGIVACKQASAVGVIALVLVLVLETQTGPHVVPRCARTERIGSGRMLSVRACVTGKREYHDLFSPRTGSPAGKIRIQRGAARATREADPDRKGSVRPRERRDATPLRGADMNSSRRRHLFQNGSVRDFNRDSGRGNRQKPPQQDLLYEIENDPREQPSISEGGRPP